MALAASLSRSRGRTRLDPLPVNGRTNKSPTRSQRRDETMPKRHFNMFDQTLLPEEDFSGGKLLRKRKTSGTSDESHSMKRRRTLPPQTENRPQTATKKFDEIQVSARPRPAAAPETAVSQPTSRARPHPPIPLTPQSSQREFRTRDKTINYTIPSLKSLLPTPPQKRQDRRASLPIPPKPLHISKLRPPESNPDVASPRTVGYAQKLTRTVTQRNGKKSLVLNLRIAPAKLGPLVYKQPRIRIVESSLGRKRRTEEAEEVEEPDPKREHEKPFGGILSQEDADTSKTMPAEIDRNRFDRARSAAAAPSSITVARSASEVPSSAGGHPIMETAFKVRAINFGNYRVKTHYASPYPEEYSRQSVLCICEFCLKYMSGDWVAWRHRLKCPVKHPPGDEIYRDGKISVFEVDGRKNPVYCQNLCLLAKMYLDHKTLYYDVEPFLFYVLCECDDRGCHFVGYFSKEKRSMAGYNLSCIVTLPIYQRKGYGFFLISFSYLLSLRENRPGSPEKPLSDLGLLSYRSYWKTTLAHELLKIVDNGENTSVQDLGRRTGMTDDDVVSGLEGLDALVKDPETGVFAIRVNRQKLAERVETVERKGYLKIKEDLLKWTPYLLGRKEARDLLEGGLQELISQRERQTTAFSSDVLMVNGVEEEVQGKDVPVERFVSVAVKDLVPPPIVYDRTEPQTPAPTDVLATSSPGSPSSSSSSTSSPDDDEGADPNVSPSSPSAIEDDVTDEPFDDEENSSDSDSDSEASSSSSSEFSSSNSEDITTKRPTNRSRLTRSNSSRTSSVKATPEVVVHLTKAPKNRAAALGVDGDIVKPKVLVAKAPRSRAGRNPPEVMSRRTSLRKP